MVVYEKSIDNDFCLITYDVKISKNALRNKIRKILKNFGAVAHNESVYLCPNKGNIAEIIKAWSAKEGINLNIWTSSLFKSPEKLNEIREVFKSDMEERLKEVRETIKTIQNDLMEKLPKDDSFKGYVNRIKSAKNSLEMAKDIARRYGDDDDHISVESLSSLLEKIETQLEKAKEQRLKQVDKGENL